jgi:hypothetical protein
MRVLGIMRAIAEDEKPDRRELNAILTWRALRDIVEEISRERLRVLRIEARL